MFNNSLYTIMIVILTFSIFFIRTKYFMFIPIQFTPFMTVNPHSILSRYTIMIVNLTHSIFSFYTIMIVILTHSVLSLYTIIIVILTHSIFSIYTITRVILTYLILFIKMRNFIFVLTIHFMPP